MTYILNNVPNNKNNFVSKKKLRVAQKVIWCRQKQVDVGRKSVSCRQKQDDAAQKKYFVLKKVINFFQNGAP